MKPLQPNQSSNQQDQPQTEVQKQEVSSELNSSKWMTDTVIVNGSPMTIIFPSDNKDR